MEGTTGGELLGRGGLGSKVLLGLRWFPIKIEQGEGYGRKRRLLVERV